MLLIQLITYTRPAQVWSLIQIQFCQVFCWKDRKSSLVRDHPFALQANPKENIMELCQWQDQTSSGSSRLLLTGGKQLDGLPYSLLSFFFWNCTFLDFFCSFPQTPAHIWIYFWNCSALQFRLLRNCSFLLEKGVSQQNITQGRELMSRLCVMKEFALHFCLPLMHTVLQTKELHQQCVLVVLSRN